ncbi:general odorant-binding protein 83a isoform X2 [Orussus abietinus]|uniref:general odorant-binding protein 83a isoform X2 n=1 Tax=Orussus abietinus TaxID=222816 RepID=UPI00062520B8|nr:general odorant-binding protein 83a isoform X2 [Orussus abietinus]
MRAELLLWVFVVLALSMPARADIRRECRKQSGVSWAALKKLKAGDLEVTDAKLKCYVKCFMQKNGLVSETGDVDVEKAVKHFPENLQKDARNVLRRCVDRPKSTEPCEKAFQVAKCYMTAHPEVRELRS